MSIHKQIIAAIKEELKTGQDLVRQGSIFITPAETYLEQAFRLPSLGIKDQGESQRELLDSMVEYEMRVRLCAWCEVLKEEASIMGDDATGAPGVLQIEAAVDAILDENLLDLESSGLISAEKIASAPSRLFGTAAEGYFLQLKTFDFLYHSQEARP